MQHTAQPQGSMPEHSGLACTATILPLASAAAAPGAEEAEAIAAAGCCCSQQARLAAGAACGVAAGGGEPGAAGDLPLECLCLHGKGPFMAIKHSSLAGSGAALRRALPYHWTAQTIICLGKPHLGAWLTIAPRAGMDSDPEQPKGCKVSSFQ